MAALMAMRCAAILLFGLALAQPYLSVDEESYDASQPLHAVLVIDTDGQILYRYLSTLAGDHPNPSDALEFP